VAWRTAADASTRSSLDNFEVVNLPSTREKAETAEAETTQRGALSVPFVLRLRCGSGLVLRVGWSSPGSRHNRCAESQD